MIDKTIGVCRFVYNLALETKTYAWKAAAISLSGYDLIKQLTELKKDFKWISEVDSQAVQASVKKLDISFKNFYRGNGYPKFKSKRGRNSFQCPNNIRGVDWEKSTLTIPKIHNIPIVLSRKFEGKIKIITISKTPSDKYFASIAVETHIEPQKHTYRKLAIGIDLGVNHFAALSTGEKIDNPKYLRSNIQRLKILQYRASRKNKGSKNRNKANLKVALLHEKIADQRNDFLHKLSTKLISDNQTDTICVEDLAVKNMVKNHKLAQAINDVSWSEFIRQLQYKGKWYGKNIIKTNRFFASSKTCSNCGHIINLLPLSMRYWKCPNCKEEHDRDINAAINIRNSGMGNAGESAELRTKVRAKKQKTR